ncbi:MAG: type II toxin-antitoxin system RelE/ParE family toxin [Caulobacter sp.]|nr:type II toxin-antitoxin system RelE/ParE family toxin [Caulobacter sp.]
MKRYGLSPGAQRDMADIWLYSAQNWGVDRADAYIRALTDAMTLLVEDPSLGVSCENIRTGYRKRLSGSHAIFYRQGRDAIVIMRVLHQNMDAVRNLH